MSFYKLLAASMVSLLWLNSCKTATPPVTEETNAAEEIVDNTFRKAVKSKDLYKSTTEAVVIDSAQVTRDTLHIFTGKLQACDAESINLIWDGKGNDTITTKAGLKLLLINESPCREVHRFHLKYNLASLHRKNNDARDTIMLQLARVKQPLLYAF